MISTPHMRPLNNDRMATLAAFRSSRTLGGAAAPALESVPPRPTQLDDAQAETALSEVQDNAPNMMQVHNNLDAARVARLLGLLD